MSRANPIKSTVSPVPRLPAHVIVYKVAASQYWWVRFYSMRKRYVIRSSKSTDKRVAFALARDLFIQDLADPKGNFPLSPKTFKAVAESLMKRQEATEKESLWRKERNQLENFLYAFLGNKLLGEISHLIKVSMKPGAAQASCGQVSLSWLYKRSVINLASLRR